MKTEIKKIDSTKRELNVEVSGDKIKNKFEEVFKNIAKDAKVPGFRAGHLPRDILEKNYYNLAHEQVLKELVPEVYNQAIEQEKLDVVELPQITQVKLDKNSLVFKAAVEVSPEIEVKNYKGLKVHYKKIEVNSEEAKRHLDSLKEARKLDTLDDAFAKGLGYPCLSELENTLEKQLFLQKESAQRQRIENDIIDFLTKSLEFKLPEPMVKRQLQELVRQSKIDLALKGIPREKIDEHEQKLTQELEPEAKKQVKVYLVLSEIAKKENIPIDNQMTSKVMELLLREANWSDS